MNNKFTSVEVLTLSFYLIISMLFSFTIIAMENTSGEVKSGKLNVFIKADSDIINYFRANFNYINYSRDMANADVSIMFLSHDTANQGEKYIIIFNGLNNFFVDLIDTLEITFMQNDSEEIKYNKLLKLLKIGLVRYINRAGYFRDVSIEYPDSLHSNAKQLDNWNYWFFNIASEGEFETEESKKEYRFEGNAFASRETHDSKIVLSLSYNRELQRFDVEEEVSESDKISTELKGLNVYGIGEHYSTGFYFSLSRSTFINTDFRASFSPAFEYSFFPYFVSLSKVLIARYQLDYIYQSYLEMSIFNKLNENLFGQSLRIKYEIKEIWGSVSFSLYGFHYLHDYLKNRIETSIDLSVRIFEGFSIETELEAYLIHDQVYLPAGKATKEEILLDQKKLASQYEIKLSFGFSYSFGSIYNNIVNTRF